MAENKQVKITRNLHEEVKEFVNGDESSYSTMKSFYEEAVREKLDRAKAEYEEALCEDQRSEIKRLMDEKIEELEQ